MYPNLLKEISKANLCTSDLCLTLKISSRLLQQKLDGLRDFSLKEALLLRNAYFPSLSLDYLFARET